MNEQLQAQFVQIVRSVSESAVAACTEVIHPALAYKANAMINSNDFILFP